MHLTTIIISSPSLTAETAAAQLYRSTIKRLKLIPSFKRKSATSCRLTDLLPSQQMHVREGQTTTNNHQSLSRHRPHSKELCCPNPYLSSSQSSPKRHTIRTSLTINKGLSFFLCKYYGTTILTCSRPIQLQSYMNRPPTKRSVNLLQLYLTIRVPL